MLGWLVGIALQPLATRAAFATPPTLITLGYATGGAMVAHLCLLC